MKPPCFASALIVLLLLSPARSYSQWEKTGFPADSLNLWVSCMAAEDGILFAGTWGNGVFRSTDGGDSWEQVNNGFPTTGGVWVYSLVTASGPGGLPYVFAGTEYNGVYLSANDGDNWISVHAGIPPYTNGIALAAGGSTVLTCTAQQGTLDGVYRSGNSGGSWAPANGGFATAADSSVYSLASITVGSQTYFYAGTAAGVFFSGSDGMSWAPIRNGLPSDVMRPMIVNPGAGGFTNITLFTGTDQHGIYRSTDNGISWVPASDGLRGISISSFVVSPVEGGTENNIISSCGFVALSTNNGDNWLDMGWPYYEAGPADCLVINGGYLYGGVNHGPGGIWKYNLAPDTTWVIQHSGSSATLYAVKAVDNNVVWCGGTQGAVLRTTNAGNNWTSFSIGSSTDIVAAVEALDANTVFAATASQSGTAIYKSTSGGSSWSQVFSQAGGVITGIQMRTSVEGYAVGSPVGGKWTILKTTNGGSNWARMATEPTPAATEYAQLGVQLLGSTIWFTSSSGKVYRTTDLGTTWSSAATSGAEVYGLHFNSPTTGLAGLPSGGINRSTNGGASWDSIHAAGYNTVSSISGIGSEFWATTGNAIAYSNTAGQSWIYSSPGYSGYVTLQAISMSPVTSPVNGWAVGDSGMIVHYRRGIVGVAEQKQAVPSSYALGQNYPNPFNPATVIKYTIGEVGGQRSEVSHVFLRVYDLLGREVATLVNERKPPGEYSVRLDASGLASGVYLYRLQAGSFVQTKKMVVMR